MSYKCIQVNELYDGQVVNIELGPAPANIISAQLITELGQALKGCNDFAAGVPNNQKLIILSGAGKHFSFGASVEEHKAEVVADMLPQFNQLVGQILASPVPLLAKVTGLCLGGGFEVAMACHFMFCDAGASFAVPEIQLGVFPPPASILLPLKIPETVANQWILTGEKISAERALQVGLVNAVAGEGELDAQVEAFIERQILPKSASSLRIASQAARRHLTQSYEQAIGQVEHLYLKTLMATHDANEGIASFLEKRKPVWQNK